MLRRYTARMSKFMTLVLVPQTSGDILAAVGTLLAPYVGEWGEPSFQMDYWTIGGLYDGVLSGGPSRVEVLDQTHPSGGRLTGRRIPEDQTDEDWLANNQSAVADLAPAVAWDERVQAYAVVTPDGHWDDLWELIGESQTRRIGYFQALLDHHCDCWAIVVMCHS